MMDSPLQTFALCRRTGGGVDEEAAIQAFGANGEPLLRRYVMPVDHVEGKSWKATFEVPENLKRSELMLRIYESELYAPFDAANASKGDVKPLVERHRLFACDVNL